MLVPSIDLGAQLETNIALSANHLLAVEFRRKSLERWLDDTTTKTENKVESRFL
jgi:hypothetical protein